MGFHVLLSSRIYNESRNCNEEMLPFTLNSSTCTSIHSTPSTFKTYSFHYLLKQVNILQTQLKNGILLPILSTYVSTVIQSKFFFFWKLETNIHFFTLSTLPHFTVDTVGNGQDGIRCSFLLHCFRDNQTAPDFNIFYLMNEHGV